MKRIAIITLCCLSLTSALAEKPKIITVNYKETEVAVKGRAKGVRIETDGKSVSIISNTDNEIKYILTGSATGASFRLDSESQQSIELQNLNLSSRSGCAIKIHSTKSTSIILNGNSNLSDSNDMNAGINHEAGMTDNTGKGKQEDMAKRDLAKRDLAQEAQMQENQTQGDQTNPKAVIYSKSKLTFSGEGCLSIHAKKLSGIASGKSINIEDGQINIAVEADAIYDSLDNDYKSRAGIKAGKNFNISGGALEINANGSGSKCIKVDGDAKFTGGTILAKANGVNAGHSQFGMFGMSGMPPMEDSLTMRGDRPMIQQNRPMPFGKERTIPSREGEPMTSREGGQTQFAEGRTMQFGGGEQMQFGEGRPMPLGGGEQMQSKEGGELMPFGEGRSMPSAEGRTMPFGGGGPMQFGGGGLMAFGDGPQRASASAKCVKVDGDISVSGGDFTFIAENHEAFESKGKMEIKGGSLYAFSKADDAVNSGLTMTISGGHVTAQSNRNDALDSNGNLQMTSGAVYAIGSMPPEEAIDANSEQGCRFYMTGGTLIAVNGIERGSQLKPKSISPSGIRQDAIYAISDSVGAKQIVFRTPDIQFRQLTIVSDKIDNSSTISELDDFSTADHSQNNQQAYFLFLQ